MNTSFLANLSPRELDVVYLLIRGYMNREIAQKLFIDIETVKTHIRNIYKKCKTTNRIDFILSYYALPNRENND